MAPKTSLRPKLRPKKKSFFEKLTDFGSGFVKDLAAIPSSMASDIGMGLNLIDKDVSDPNALESGIGHLGYDDRTAITRARNLEAARLKTIPTSRDDDKQRTVADVLAPSDDPMSDALQKAADDLAKEKAKATEDTIQQTVAKRFRSGARGRRSLLRSKSGGGMGFYNRFAT
jgi:hypothetical protein